ncbi:MAG: TadE/TadG family type IV pilus assembly protein [Pirellulaceae bacterium]|nr:TadE/TadG family type IV pilus assembly protein [Pirellulaceae bacterium]
MRVTKKRQTRKGAAAVEFAMVLPVLFLLLFGCYEFGRANMIRHTTQAAAYEAARVAIVPGATAREARQTAAYFLSTSGVRLFDIDIKPRIIRDNTKTVRVKISVRMRENSSIGLLFSEAAVFEGDCILNRETL